MLKYSYLLSIYCRITILEKRPQKRSCEQQPKSPLAGPVLCAVLSHYSNLALLQQAQHVLLRGIGLGQHRG